MFNKLLSAERDDTGAYSYLCGGFFGVRDASLRRIKRKENIFTLLLHRLTDAISVSHTTDTTRNVEIKK